ncbi:hypothetical protein [Scytonema sp. NUACC26]|uniref:hypothetical protein n=1 Tax=Scytonema sp. NUACC26 TaxID=3140176 RepID=UPI0034DC3193
MTTTLPKLDEFTFAYIEAALWSSLDDDDEPMDKHYSIEDIHVFTLEEMIADCHSFQEKAGDRLHNNWEQAGHDFWLTRNRHGCGFWDGFWDKELGKELTDLSHSFGEYDLYVGNDDLIYGYP